MTAEIAEEFANELIAVYPATAKLSSWTISRHVGAVLDTLDAGEDPIPAEVREKHDLWPRELAIRAIHRPQDRAELRHARKRLKWDEAFTMQAALAQRRLRRRRDAVGAAPADPTTGSSPRSTGGCRSRSPTGQRVVGEDIAHDLACAYPMNRLLQGEVGSGKTVVAVRAMLQVVDAGGQAALLAPTEVLAQQHYRSITALLGPLAAPRPAQLGARRAGDPGGAAHRLDRRAGAPQSALTDVFTGDAGILIGTHALLEDRVRFADLGLVVIDEQHRFGVEQRDALRDKTLGSRPHVLVMTATPIPRTVAMTVFGDLEVSTLSELPGRPLADRHATWCPPSSGRASSSGRGSGSARRSRPDGRRTWSARGSAASVGRVRRRRRTPTTSDEPTSEPTRTSEGGGQARRRRTPAVRRWRCSTWPRRSRRARWPGCASASCTASSTRTRRTG